MSVVDIGEERLKTLLKEAIVEVLEERRDFMRDLLEEMLEDVALVEAIKEGEGTETVSRDEISKVLENGS